MLTHLNYKLDSKIIPYVMQKSWVPISRISQINEKRTNHVDIASIFGDPKSISIVKLDEEYKVINDICPHRQELIFNVNVKNGIIKCPYHSNKLNVNEMESYPVFTEDGLLFINMSNEDITPPNIFKGYGNERERIVQGQYDINSGAFDVIESILNSMSEKCKKRNPYNINHFISTNMYNYDYRSSGKRTPTRVSNGFDGAFSVFSHNHFGENLESYTKVRVYVMPISEYRSRIFWSTSRNFMINPTLDYVVNCMVSDTYKDSIVKKNKSSLINHDWLINRYRNQIHNMRE